MKKSLLFIFLVVLSMSLKAQSSVTVANQMESGVDAKKAALEFEAYIDAKDNDSFIVPFSPQFTSAVLSSENTVEIGSAGNLYTILRGTSNMVDADESLNTVVFLHRNNPFQFGESTSQYRYDISTDGGATFTSDVGPLSTIASGTNVTNGQARYPQVAIQDNGTVESSFLTYWGATHDGTSSNVWDGTTWGVARLDNDPSTFTTGATVWNNGDVLIPNALVKGLDGEFWSNDIENFGANVDGVLILYKGTVDAADPTGISWEIYQTFDQMYQTTTDDAGTEFSANATVTMGFSPDGMQGYMMTVADGILPDYAPAVYAPYVWTTNDGGVTWEGPSTVDIRNFEGFVQDDFANLDFGDGTIVETEPCFAFYQPDMVVDANGDAHMTCLLNSQFIDQASGAPQDYSIYGGGGANEVVDVVYSASSDTWSVLRFGDGLDATILSPSDTVIWDDANAAFTNTARVQASRNADGSKVFFTWLDSEPTQSAGDFVSWRDMKGVGLDVATGMSSPVYNWTADGDCAGQAFYCTVAPHVLVDGDTYKIPAVFTAADVTATGSDLGETFFSYFQGATIGGADFTLPTTASTYTENPPVITSINQTGGSLSRDFDLEGIDPEFVYEVTWDFGDGSATATGITTSHDFPNAAMTYTVTACAENYDGITCATTEVVIVPVNDDIAPEIVLADGDAFTVEGGLDETYEVPEYSATDQIGAGGDIVDVTDDVVVTGDYDPTMLNDYTITYTVTDAAGNPTTVTQTVTVVDTQNPILEAQVSTDRELCVGEDLTDINTLFTVEDAFIASDEDDFAQYVNFDAPDSYDEAGEYEVTYTAVDPNGNSSDPIIVTYTVCECDGDGECIEGGVGIEDLQLANSIELAPNPTSGMVNMTIGDVNGQFTVEVYDVQGKEFLMAQSYSNSNVTLNLTDAPSGVYFVKVETTEAVAVKRIIVE